MSNLFGMDFEKEGKGVPEDGTKESGFVRFFKIVQRKFWGMIRLNLMQVVGSLPAFALSAGFISYMYVGMMKDNVEYDLALRIFLAFMLVSMQLVTIGPVQAGFIYTMRNYAREENVFVWSDFIKGIKENWKRATAVCLIDLAVMLAVSYVYMFYNLRADETGMMGEACKVILIIFAAIYAMMHIYIYPMMVTLDLTVKQLYGNSLRFVFGKLLPNLGILLLMVAISMLMFLNIIVGIAAMLIIGYSFLNLLSTFYAYCGIEKHIIKKIREGQSSAEG